MRVVLRRGEDEDARCQPVRLQCPEYPDAVQAGHEEVEQHHIGPQRADGFERRDAVGGLAGDFDALSAVQNVAAGLLYCGIAARQRQELAIEALHLVGLSQRLGHRPSQLSGGEQQRVAIARALVGRPAMMLADEPTGNLDQATGREIVALLRELNTAEGTALVVITHDQAVASAMDRQVELRDGRIVAEQRNQPVAEQRNPVTLEGPGR